MEVKMRTLIKNIGFLATPEGTASKKGSYQGKIKIEENAFIEIDDEIISRFGTGEASGEYDQVIDAEGCLVTPGLVDAHTHLVFGGWREHELVMKLRGVPYLDILAQGGGILSTVRKTRAAEIGELAQKAEKALREMLALGTTTCEAKSGYGLNLEYEVKQLQVIELLKNSQPVELVATFLGAHAVPEEFSDNREGYIKKITNEIIPYVAQHGLAEFCDVFCETGVFSEEETEEILKAGLEYGLIPKVHADEINPIGGSQLAGKLKAISAEHLICTTDEGIQAMAEGGTSAVLLPVTSFYLDKTFARARDMINAGVPAVIATDFNPGSSPNLSMQMAMNIGCYKYRMTPEEVLTAATLNAAAAINRAESIGSIEAGKQADIVLWDAPNLDYIFYRFGSNLVKHVIKKGKLVV
jgi:imidazolonepropionase